MQLFFTNALVDKLKHTVTAVVSVRYSTPPLATHYFCQLIQLLMSYPVDLLTHMYPTIYYDRTLSLSFNGLN